SAHGAAYNAATAKLNGLAFQTAKGYDFSSSATVPTVTESITNSGTVNVGLSAQASGGDVNHAYADFSDIWYQKAGTNVAPEFEQNVSETIINSGPITLTGKASATGLATSTQVQASARLND